MRETIQLDRVTLWLSGPSCAQRIAWASWLSSLLMERGLAVEVVAIEGPGEAPDDDEGEERVVDRCRRLLADGRVPLVAEGCFSRARRERLHARLGGAINLALEAPADVQSWPGFESPAAPDVTVGTDLAGRAEVEARVLELLAARGLVPSDGGKLKREEAILIDRLRGLGYL